MKSARYTLGLLLVIYVVNQIDRQIMNILIEPVKNDLLLNDTQMGWLVGGAFAIFYTLAGFPIARMADRGNRRNIMALALLIWSAMTVASGLSRNFAQLMAARIGVGVGEAGCTPPAHSIISDSFPIERRATAIAIYSLGVPIGLFFGLSLGGVLAEQLGWRTAFFVAGAPGVALALLTRLTLREPERGAFDQGASTAIEPLGATLHFIGRLPAMRQVLLGTGLQTLCMAGLGTFNASFLIRVHDFSISQAGLTLGLISGVAGAASVMGAGALADRLGQRDLRWHCWLPSVGALVSIPFSVIAYTTDEPRLAVAMITLATLGNHMYSGLGHFVVQGLAKPRMRAMTSATALFVMNLVGFGLGPIAVGVLSDRFGGGTQIRYALLSLLVCLAWASVHYLLAARSYRQDLEAKSN